MNLCWQSIRLVLIIFKFANMHLYLHVFVLHLCIYTCMHLCKFEHDNYKLYNANVFCMNL